MSHNSYAMYELVLTKIFAKDFHSTVQADGVTIRLAAIVLSGKTRGIVDGYAK